MKFYDAITSGISHLQQHRLRSGLSILGILIGVASVLCMIAIGDGTQKIIADDIEKLGGPNHVRFWVRPYAGKPKKRTKEKLATGIFAVITLVLILFWTPIGGHATKSIYAAARMRPPIPGQNSSAAVFKWMNESLPQESVIAANWGYGTQLNVLGGVKTVVDSDHFIPHWIHLYYRHVFSAQDTREALEFLKTHKTTHLMLTERGVLSQSRNYSSMGSDENSDRQFSLYQLTRTETPIGTPYRMQPRGTGTPLAYIEIARTSPDTVSITAHFKIENAAAATEELGASLMKDVRVERIINTPTSRISVDIGNGGLVLDFDAETRVRRAYYIPPLGWNSLAVKLFLRGEHSDIFIPVYPIDDSAAKDIKVWKIHYPADIETNEKYLYLQF